MFAHESIFRADRVCQNSGSIHIHLINFRTYSTWYLYYMVAQKYCAREEWNWRKTISLYDYVDVNKSQKQINFKILCTRDIQLTGYIYFLPKYVIGKKAIWYKFQNKFCPKRKLYLEFASLGVQWKFVKPNKCINSNAYSIILFEKYSSLQFILC